MFAGCRNVAINTKVPMLVQHKNYKDLAMESLDYWRLCDELNIVQAALLVIGKDPSTNRAHKENTIQALITAMPDGYEAAKTAITNAVVAGDLTATIRRDAIMGHVVEEKTERWMGTIEKRVLNLDVNLTTMKVKDLREWLSNRGISTGFFFPQNHNRKLNYLDTGHTNYSPKLAAAIEAWVAVTEAPESKKGKSVKKALEIWLRGNAGRFGLIKPDGNPNQTGIEEVIKVANWATKGGAPKTPAS
jgi:hypothetical protein